VLIVDDAEFVRDGLHMALDAAPDVEVVGEAADGAAGIAEATRLRPDVVLMDVRMPVLDGLAATRRLVDLDGPPMRVLMLTTFDLDDYLVEALQAGVSGFTLKDTPPDDLVAAIVAIARDDALVEPETTVRLIERAARKQPPVPLDGLSDGERLLLELVAAGLSDADIAARLGAGASQVGADVAQLRAKLGARDRVHAVLAAHRAA
jgi:DNA-binding NarL/FixJ family response regulator